jgi:Type IV pilin-like G and H, putative
MKRLNKSWLKIGAVVAVSLAVIYGLFLLNDCPKSLCANPTAYHQKHANATVYAITKRFQKIILEDKALISEIEESKHCLKQDETYIYICQIIDRQSIAPQAIVYAFSRQNQLKSYVGRVFVVAEPQKKAITTNILCEAQAAGTGMIVPPTEAQTCGEKTVPVVGKVIP